MSATGNIFKGTFRGEDRLPAEVVRRVDSLKEQLRWLQENGWRVRVWPIKDGFHGSLYPEMSGISGTRWNASLPETREVADAAI